ncbi:MAG TPA: proline--tRNA ligase, partial [Thermoplasmatales archaeon]|nr:proline--tRNA ligase [Thermoplasmatales archaeon]
RGVPVRVEVGPRDVEKGTVVLARRDTGEKKEVKIGDVVSEVQNLFEEISRNLTDAAKKLLKSNFFRVTSVEEAKGKRGIVEIPWCGREECAVEMETILDMRTLGEPLDFERYEGICPVCGEKAETWVRLAKTY